MSGSGSSKRFGLSLKKKDDDKKPKITSAFDNDDSDEEKVATTSAAQRFDEKYSSSVKKRDQRLLEKAVAEDPTIFEYDSIHEKLENQRHKSTVEQREADKEKKPKYAEKIINAHKKRQLDQLLTDERTYKKEREAEGAAFDDKEVFITGAYRQQIEERNKFREEQEKQDAIDGMTKVEDQRLWQTAFQHHMLNMTARIDETTLKSESAEGSKDVKPPVEQAESKPIVADIKSEPKVEIDQLEQRERQTRPARESHRDRSPAPGNRTPPREQRRHERSRNSPPRQLNRSPSPKQRDQRRHERQRNSPPRRSYRSPSPKQRTGGRRSRSPRDRGPREALGPKGGRGLTEKEREREQIRRRMEKIREILRKRNGEDEIEEAKRRFLERKEGGHIVPPLC